MRTLILGGTGPELKLDLSGFKTMNFMEYLPVLELDNLNISFYETLIKVVLPDLNCHDNHSCDATKHSLRKSSEAGIVFRYLKSKGVKHIIEAVIPDCMVHPHANRYIIDALRPFNVKRLNWRKLDIGVETIKRAAPDVEVLTLHSSGDWDALSRWVGVDGLCQLPKVAVLHLLTAFHVLTYRTTVANNPHYHFQCLSPAAFRDLGANAVLRARPTTAKWRTFAVNAKVRFGITKITVFTITPYDLWAKRAC